MKAYAGWGADKTAETAADASAYAKDTAQSYANVGQKQAAAAQAKAKVKGTEAYNAAADTAKDTADYASAKASAGWGTSPALSGTGGSPEISSSL